MIIIDNTPQISLKQLRKDGLFEGWYAQRYESHGMRIDVELVDEDTDDCRVLIEWTRWHETYKQYIPLIRVETNLSMGYYRWFFTDYEREIKFIKVYFNGTRFVPRVDLKYAYYSCQLKSHSDRAFDDTFRNPLLLATKVEQMLKKPFRKRHYNGKPTRTQLLLEKDVAKLRVYGLTD
ncbi:hypothetical protein JW887_03640 [Candidatus Dojkabacteria bacterium]|nr:hypothetical protein [Candidatus Dojkabacteria bacterium]